MDYNLSHIAGTPYIHIGSSPFSVDELNIFDLMIASEEAVYVPRVKESSRSITLSKALDFTTEFGKSLYDNYYNIVRLLDDGSDIFDNYPYEKMVVGRQEKRHKMANVGYIHEELRCSPPGEDYEIHKDSTNKLLTCLIYLEPEVSNGTFFHESKDDLPGIEHKWKRGTGYIFKSGRGSFHSYKNTTDNLRWVYMANLYQKNPFTK